MLPIQKYHKIIKSQGRNTAILKKPILNMERLLDFLNKERENVPSVHEEVEKMHQNLDGMKGN